MKGAHTLYLYARSDLNGLIMICIHRGFVEQLLQVRSACVFVKTTEISLTHFIELIYQAISMIENTTESNFRSNSLGTYMDFGSQHFSLQMVLKLYARVLSCVCTQISLIKFWPLNTTQCNESVANMECCRAAGRYIQQMEFFMLTLEWCLGFTIWHSSFFYIENCSCASTNASTVFFCRLPTEMLTLDKIIENIQHVSANGIGTECFTCHIPFVCCEQDKFDTMLKLCQDLLLAISVKRFPFTKQIGSCVDTMPIVARHIQIEII